GFGPGAFCCAGLFRRHVVGTNNNKPQPRRKKMKQLETSDNGNLVVSADTAEGLIPILLEAHTEESDDASKMLAQLLREFGAVERATGTPGHDYTAIIQFGGEKWLVED